MKNYKNIYSLNRLNSIKIVLLVSLIFYFAAFAGCKKEEDDLPNMHGFISSAHTDVNVFEFVSITAHEISLNNEK